MGESSSEMNSISVSERLAWLQEAASPFSAEIDLEAASKELAELSEKVLGVRLPTSEVGVPTLLEDEFEDSDEFVLPEVELKNFWAFVKRLPLTIDQEEQIRCAREIEAGVFASAVLVGEMKFDKFYEPADLLEIQRIGAAAYDRMIRGNLRLVLHWAKAHRGREVDEEALEDAFQDGVLGLMRAIEGWDVDRGYQFSTFASWHIRQRIMRAKQDTFYFLRIPVHVQEQWSNLPPEKWSPLVQYAREIVNRVVSWELLEEHDDELEHSEIGDGSEVGDDNIPQQDTQYILSVFNTGDKYQLKELDIIIRRFGLENEDPVTLDDIGKNYGVTRERIRQLESSALNRIRLNLLAQSNELRSAILAYVFRNYPAEFDAVNAFIQSQSADPPPEKKRSSIKKSEAKRIREIIAEAYSAIGGAHESVLYESW